MPQILHIQTRKVRLQGTIGFLGVYGSVPVLENLVLPHGAIAFSPEETHFSSRILNRQVLYVVPEGTEAFL